MTKKETSSFCNCCWTSKPFIFHKINLTQEDYIELCESCLVAKRGYRVEYRKGPFAGYITYDQYRLMDKEDRAEYRILDKCIKFKGKWYDFKW